MGQEFNQFMYDMILKWYYKDAFENNLEKSSEEIRGHVKILMEGMLAEASDKSAESNFIDPSVKAEEEQKMIILQKIYLSLDEIKPKFLIDEMTNYTSNYSLELIRKKREKPLPVVKVKVIETFKAPRIEEGSKLSEFLKKF